MDDLCSHGWKLEAAEEAEDIDEVDMKELFIEADIARRNSLELVVTPTPKVNSISFFQNLLDSVFYRFGSLAIHQLI